MLCPFHAWANHKWQEPLPCALCSHTGLSLCCHSNRVPSDRYNLITSVRKYCDHFLRTGMWAFHPDLHVTIPTKSSCDHVLPNADGAPMEPPWSPHGSPMEPPWNPHGAPMRAPRSHRGAPMEPTSNKGRKEARKKGRNKAGKKGRKRE